MNDVRMPIKTIREGNKITKICVEDVYKTLNKIIEPLDKAREYLDRFDTEYEDFEGSLIIGVGTSEPHITDAFDEEIGNDIAFMKSKLKINLKKWDLLVKEWFNIVDVLAAIESEGDKIESLIEMDINGLKRHNPSFKYSSYTPFFNDQKRTI